jgi:hypothetical protein
VGVERSAEPPTPVGSRLATLRQSPGLLDAAAWLWLTLLTVLVWARPVLAGFGHLRLSNPGDSNAFEFYIAWNLHAFLHAKDPFFTSVMYAPSGLDLGNAISIPGPSLLVAPITLLFGPTAAYNVAFLLPILLAGGAVYLLARELGADRAGATAAGSLMTLSPYFAGHALGHMNLMWVFGLPTVAWLVARHVRGRLRLRWMSVGVALTLALALASSAELFVTQALFGVIGWLVALVFGGPEHRRALLRGGVGVVLGGIGGLVLGLPVIYASLRSGVPEAAANPTANFPADLTNLFAPTELMTFGSRTFADLRSHWLGNNAENTAYLTPPLILLVVAAVWVGRGSRRLAGLLAFGAIALMFSFGPYLTVDGVRTVSLPWRIATRLPVIEHALPVRFSAFVWMAVALLVAVLWTGRHVPRSATALLTLSAAALLIPNPDAMAMPVDTSVPAYFKSGEWKQDIDRGENVLVLAPGEVGPGLRWSAATGFAFNTPTGNGGGASLPPALKDPTAAALFWQQFNPQEGYDWSRHLPRYLDKLGIRHVLVDPADQYWVRVMSELYPGLGRQKQGVLVYALPGTG